MDLKSTMSTAERKDCGGEDGLSYLDRELDDLIKQHSISAMEAHFTEL